MGLLDGKKALIFGVANDKSIAWVTAEILAAEGAEVALTYAGDAFESRVEPLAKQTGAKIVLPCDVTKDSEIKKVFQTVQEEWGGLDMLIHSVAFAKKEELKNDFISTSREGFNIALEVSAYSLIAIAREALPLMEGRGDASITTLTYLGAQRVVKNYNVMGVAKAALEASVKYLAYDMGRYGIRVNALSAGPLRTLAAMGIPGFRDILNVVQRMAPLKRNINADDVAKSALYLASPLSSGVTGETLYVDSGFHAIGIVEK
ncbi:MAG: enoyl-ACP reductase [Deltaproteobacteria bacterium]|nr:enoyl-ACP reductase [Deltaproteobacteria bacterium]